MIKKITLIVGVLVLACAVAAHWYFSEPGHLTTEPEFTGLSRTVSDNQLISAQDPAAILQFSPNYQYVGGQKFILYGIADTEQHFFVETTGDNQLKSVYWVQYEAYLPGKDYTYNYEHSPLRLTLGDYEFYTDTDIVESDPNRKRRPGTDGAMARQFLASKGYVLPKNWAYARLVHLTDASRQKELMIIFIDDLSAQGLTATELKVDGAKAALRSEVELAHLEHIRNTLTMLPRQTN
jgi:hypothetical protein